MPRANAADLSPSEFRRALSELGFAYLGFSVDKYVDLKFPRRGRYVDPVRGPRKRMLRRRTLEALQAARSKHERERQAVDAIRARQAATAARLAPRAAPVDRATLANAAAIHQLAEDFRIMATASEGVTFKDLILAGWSREQIIAYGDDARRLGYARESGAAA